MNKNFKISSLVALVFLAMSATISPANSATVFGISGDKFTINGQPTFLLGTSYYDVAGWTTSDLDALKARKFNLVRIFLDWPGAGRSFFNSDGSMRNTTSLLNFISACEQRGIVVDVTVLWGLSSPVGISGKTVAIRNAVSLLGGRPNVFFDLANEHNGFSDTGGTTWSDSNTVMKSMITAARGVRNNLFLTYSSVSMVFPGWHGHIVNADDSVIPSNIDGELAAGIDIISPHLGREANWYDRTDTRVKNIKNYLISRGRNIPIYLQEENRRGGGEGGGDIPASLFLQAAKEAKTAGAAAWIFHTDAGFNMSTQTFMSQLDPIEVQIANTIGNYILGTTPDTTVPSVPANLNGTAASSSQVNLTWSAATDNAGGSGVGGYNVYRDGVYVTSVTGTSYNNTGLAANTSYNFTVASYDNAGNKSAQGAIKAIKTLAGGGGIGLPDLVVTSLSYSNGNFTARVKNQGAAPALAPSVLYYVDGAWKTWGYVSTPLAAGASVDIYTQGGSYVIPNGTHTILAFADDKNRIAESNETNNVLSQTITIGTTAFVPPTITSPANNAVVTNNLNKVTISWGAVSGATGGYALRMADNQDSTIRDSRNTNNNSAYLYIDNYKGTSITMNVRTGHTYRFWMHSTDSAGKLSGGSYLNFSYKFQ